VHLYTLDELEKIGEMYREVTAEHEQIRHGKRLSYGTMRNFRALPEDARTVFLYLLTCPHGNMCGIFYLPDLYAASDLQWDAETVSEGYR